MIIPPLAICTLQQGKQLLEMGVQNDSLFCWIGDDNPDPKHNMSYQIYHTEYAYSEIGSGFYQARVPAFSAFELSLMLPIGVSISKGERLWACRYWWGDVATSILRTGQGTTASLHKHDPSFLFTSSVSMAHCMADMLIFILSHNFISVDQVNKQLNERYDPPGSGK